MTWREYKSKLRGRGNMRKVASDESWDTHEAWTWIDSNESTREAALDAVANHRADAAAYLRQLVHMMQAEHPDGLPNVDLDAVDWEGLAVKYEDDLAEAMANEADDFINPPPTERERIDQMCEGLPPERDPRTWQAGDVVQDRRGARAHVQAPLTFDPYTKVPMTHIAPDEYYHGQDVSLHPSAVVNTYGYQKVDNKPLDYNWTGEPSMDQPGTMTFPESWG